MDFKLKGLIVGKFGSQKKFAHEAGIAPEVVSDYVRGYKGWSDVDAKKAEVLLGPEAKKLIKKERS